MPAKVYDVVVVGSGAGGGTLSAQLANQGADVLVVEGGPTVNTRTDFNTHALPFEFANRHIPVMKLGKPGFDSERSRGVGGKTMLWNAVALRMSQRDFKGRQHDGAGEDWPIDYADMAPYYDRIEREVGVCGNYDHLKDLPDGIFLPPVPMKCTDKMVQAGAKKLGVPVIHVRKSTLTKARNGRPACHFCGNCMAGCDVVAKYNSYDVHMNPAVRAGKPLTIQPNSIVYELGVSDEAKVNAVRYFNRETGVQGEARGRVVVVACACVQSVALLLMSKSSRFPAGLANSSGELGKNFIPHINCGVEAFLEEKIGHATVNDEGFLDHAYVPSFMHDRKRDYARSFGVQFNYQNRRSVGWARSLPGMGAAFKKSVTDRYPAYLTFTGYQELLPNKDSYIDLDQTKDEFGLPRARRHWKLSDADLKLYEDMKRWCQDILVASNATIHSVSAAPTTNHEIGGCRMGSDPKRSVLNAFCRAHDVPNLYAVDASAFPSASEKNPTHTIMALASRTADHIGEQLKKGVV
ncbi:MAG: GMC family oxidoreductase [Acidobacteriota bacterium]|nr:GMC family oxidoreductase [Acidobacteriota bacterium]